MSEDSLSRRDFLKVGLLGATAVAAAGCKAFDTLFGYQPESETPPPPSPGTQAQTEAKSETPDSADNMIIFGEPGEDIWQVNLKPGQNLTQAVESVAPWSTWSGFALTWISADRARAVHFTGPKGLGSRALLTWNGLTQKASQSGLENLARFNPQTAAPNDAVIFGNTSVVGKNFNDLLNSEKLSSLSEYLSVNLNFNPDNQSWALGLNLTKHLKPGDPDYLPGQKEWQAVPLAGFTSTGREGIWTQNR